MERYKEFIPGRRILKTGIAVFISVQLFYFFGHHTPTHAALACILTLRTTSDETKERGKNRLIGTLVGGLSSYLGLVLLQYLPITTYSGFAPIVIASFVYLSLWIGKSLHLEPYAITISAVVATVTMISHNQHHTDALSYVSLRMLETLVGFLIAYLVNKYFFKRKKLKKMENK